MNASDSSVRLRIHRPKKASGRASRNGTRQPQAIKASEDIDWDRIRIRVPPTTEGRAVAARVMFSQKPRLLIGACSNTNAGAPTDSPPAEKPWTMRHSTSSSGASAPTVA